MLPKIKFGIATVITVGLTAFGQTASAITLSFGTQGSGNGQFSSPYGVAVDSSGNVYAADQDNQRIVKFNSSSFATSFTSFSNGQLSSPQGIAVDTNGNVFVADSGNNSIVELNPTSSTFTSFGSLGSGSGQFNDPVGVAVANGIVYVADGINNRIVEFNPSNFTTSFTSFGTSGSGNGQFSTPQGVAVDANGNVFVADSGNNRIVEYNPTSSTFNSFGSLGSTSGQFNDPFGVAVANGNVYVADYLNNRLDVFSSSNFGTFNSFNSPNAPVGGTFFAPSSVAIDAIGNIYAADPSNSRIVELVSSGSVANPNPALAPVPEPSEVLGILALGLLGLSSRFRRSNPG